MKTYTFAEVGSNFQQVGGDCPDGWIIMNSKRPDVVDSNDFTAQPDGTWSITQETINSKLIINEGVWRDEQMPIAQQNVTALEYGAEYIPGTVLQWKKYWLALRKWTADNPDFPDSTKRPVAPT